MKHGGYVGASLRRREDDRILRGNARYIGDLRFHGMVDVAIVRSTEPHARLLDVHTDLASAVPGVIDVVRGADLDGHVRPFTKFVTTPGEVISEAYEVLLAPYFNEVMPSERVVRFGEPVAAVIARDRAIAEDAAELVEVEYEPLPVLASAAQALAPDAPQLREIVPGNVAARMTARVGKPDQELADAPHRLEERFVIRRSSGSPIGMRGTIALWNADREELTVWSTTQRPHLLRSYIAQMLDLEEGAVRVAAPDIGGSFGGAIYSEEILVAHLAMRLRRPVRWLEDRREAMVNGRHSRDQVHDVQAGFDDSGRVLALIDEFTMDVGSANPFGVNLLHNTLLHLPGPYKLEHLGIRGTCCLTNKLQITPVRGTGRPEATFVLERVLDMIARRLGLSQVEVRLANLIGPGDMPYRAGLLDRDGEQLLHGEGDYPAQLHAALAKLGEGPDTEAGGPLIGVGVAALIETTGSGPFEGATVGIERDGTVHVLSGVCSQGQGHETVLAQIAADELGLPFEQVRVTEGDTRLIERGAGTFASRTIVVAGSAVKMAAAGLKRELTNRGATLLGVDADAAIFQDRAIRAPGGAVPLRAVLAHADAEASHGSASASLPASGPAGAAPLVLQETAYFYPNGATLASSTHAVRVSVDPDLGEVKVLDYVIAHDAGVMINPAIVEGQMHGGVVHGIGNALYEEVMYDDGAMPLTPTLKEYALPTIGDVPLIEDVALDFPAATNPLGAKGVGEGGTVGAPAAVVNAIADALGDPNVRLNEFPMTQERLVAAIERARHRAPAKACDEGERRDVVVNKGETSD